MQVRFSGQRTDVNCAIEFDGDGDRLAPGDTVDAALNCFRDFRVVDGQWNFVLYEGKRKIGEGVLHP
jgi:translation elongation factor EF-Tu-like GTPase